MTLILDPGNDPDAAAEIDPRTVPVLGRRRLTTAEILYHLPDHPGLLQSFTWQCLDLAPNFPRLLRFLDFWSHNLDATLHSVRVMQSGARRGQPVRSARWHEIVSPTTRH